MFIISLPTWTLNTNETATQSVTTAQKTSKAMKMCLWSLKGCVSVLISMGGYCWQWNVLSAHEHMKDRWWAFILQILRSFTFQSKRGIWFGLQFFDQNSLIAISHWILLDYDESHPFMTMSLEEIKRLSWNKRIHCQLRSHLEIR